MCKACQPSGAITNGFSYMEFNSGHPDRGLVSGNNSALFKDLTIMIGQAMGVQGSLDIFTMLECLGI